MDESGEQHPETPVGDGRAAGRLQFLLHFCSFLEAVRGRWEKQENSSLDCAQDRLCHRKSSRHSIRFGLPLIPKTKSTLSFGQHLNVFLHRTAFCRNCYVPFQHCCNEAISVKSKKSFCIPSTLLEVLSLLSLLSKTVLPT